MDYGKIGCGKVEKWIKYCGKWTGRIWGGWDGRGTVGMNPINQI